MTKNTIDTKISTMGIVSKILVIRKFRKDADIENSPQHEQVGVRIHLTPTIKLSGDNWIDSGITRRLP
jgi:hypothetical protein